MSRADAAPGRSTGADAPSYLVDTMGETKTKMFALRLTPELHAQLMKIAEAEDIPAGHVLRRMIEARYAELRKEKRGKK